MQPSNSPTQEGQHVSNLETIPVSKKTVLRPRQFSGRQEVVCTPLPIVLEEVTPLEAQQTTHEAVVLEEIQTTPLVVPVTVEEISGAQNDLTTNQDLITKENLVTQEVIPLVVPEEIITEEVVPFVEPEKIIKEEVMTEESLRALQEKEDHDQVVSEALQKLLDRKIDNVLIEAETVLSSELTVPNNQEIVVGDEGATHALSVSTTDMQPSTEVLTESSVPVAVITEASVVVGPVSNVPVILESAPVAEMVTQVAEVSLEPTPHVVLVEEITAHQTEEIKSPGQEISVPVVQETISVTQEHVVEILPSQTPTIEIPKNPGQEIHIPINVEASPIVVATQETLPSVEVVVPIQASPVMPVVEGSNSIALVAQPTVTPPDVAPVQTVAAIAQETAPVIKRGFLDRLNSFIGEAPKTPPQSV